MQNMSKIEKGHNSIKFCKKLLLIAFFSKGLKSARNFAFLLSFFKFFRIFLKVIFALFQSQTRAKRIKKSKIVFCKRVLECNFAHITWSGRFNFKKRIGKTIVPYSPCWHARHSFHHCRKHVLDQGQDADQIRSSSLLPLWS